MLKGNWNTRTPPVRRGETNPHAKLTEGDVRLIRGSVESHTALAVRLGVSDTTIRRIRQGVKWRHVTGSQTGPDLRSSLEP